MTAFDRLLAAGAVTMPRRHARHPWRQTWSLWGPLLPLAFAAGLVAGAVVAFLLERFT